MCVILLIYKSAFADIALIGHTQYLYSFGFGICLAVWGCLFST